jgi:hypothetical protein
MLTGKYASRSSAVHAGFEMFCIPGRQPANREFSDTSTVLMSNDASAWPDRIAQNAGCMMATHANCTKSKIAIFYNSLIFKDLL